MSPAATDEELLAGYCATSDPECFEQLVKRHRRQMVTWSEMVVHRSDIAEEAVQDALLSVHLQCRTFKGESTVKTWLFRIVRNACVSSHRRRTPTIFAELPENLPNLFAEREQVKRDRFSDLRRAVRCLKPSYRTIVSLVYFDEMPYQDAADRLGIPIGTVRSRLFRAMASLRGIVKTHGEFQCRHS